MRNEWKNLEKKLAILRSSCFQTYMENMIETIKRVKDEEESLAS